MSDELEALVGYVFVVGGRAVSAPPPGSLLELPPRKAQRGREQDTFFTLITPTGSQAQAALYEGLARRAADAYFRSGGSVTSGLREVVGAVNSGLLDHNEQTGQQVEVSMTALVLRGHEVYAARAGLALCFLRQGDEFACYPDPPEEIHTANPPRLGMTLTPDVRLARYEVAPAHVMFICDPGYSHADPEKIREALGRGGTPAIIEALKGLSAREAQGMVIEFVSGDAPNPHSVTPPTRATGAHPGVKVGEPARVTGQLSIPAQASGVSKNPVDFRGAPSTSVQAAVSAPRPLPVAVSAGVESPTDQAEAPAPDMEAEAAPQAIHSPEDAPPESAEDTGFQPEMAHDTALEPLPGAARQRLLRGVGVLLGRIAKLINLALDRVLPEPSPEGGPRIPAMMAAVLAILIPVSVVFVVVAVRLSQFDLTQFEQQVAEVEEAARQAEAISLDDAERARTAWRGVIQRVELVEVGSGRYNDATLAKIRAKAQEILDKFDKVTRRTPVPLRNFGEGASLAAPVIRGGADVYMLDKNASAIYRDTLNPNATALFTRNTQPVVQKGQAVGAYSVRQLVDAIWVSEGGVQRPNVLAALDLQGILVTYSPTFAPATGQRLAGADLWNNPVAMTAWRGNLYLLDPAANQIWRYRPVGNSYPNPPEPYFSDDSERDLANAVDFDIDTGGGVFVLFKDGTIKRYLSAREQPFSYSEMPDNKGPGSAVSMFLDTDSALPAMYIVDPEDQSIYQITLAGKFRYRFRATDHSFRQLTGVFADRNGNIYASSGTTLYHFSISDLTPPGE